MIRILYLMLSMVVFAAGCGYKGPLILPEKPVAAEESNSATNTKDTKKKLP